MRIRKGNRMAFEDSFGFVLYEGHIRVGCVSTAQEAEEFVYESDDAEE